MKNLKNPKRFLKLLLPLIFSIFMSPLLAQPHLCNDPCPPGPIQNKIINLCKFSWVGTLNCPGSPPMPYSLTDEPFVFVMIDYRLRTCNGVTSVIIEDYVYMDIRDYWINNFYPGCTAAPSIASAIAASGCPYPDPSSPSLMKQAVRDAVNQLLVDLNIPQSFMEVYFKGACYSMVKLSFPNGAFFVGTPDDLGHIDTTFLSAGSTVSQRIPCNDACCKVTFEQKIITLANGETTSTYRAISYEGDGPSCDIQPLPDYNLYNPKIEATMIDPVTGGTISVTGNVVGQEPCELTCPQYCLGQHPEVFARTTLKTDLISKEAPLQFSANPTLVNNYIRFASNQPITKVLVYDMSGKIIMNISSLDNDSELNTSELKTGPYFVTVFFAGNDVKTVKILKQ